MKTLDEVMGRCYVDEAGHWLWRGATFENSPRIYGPNLAKGGVMESQHGRKVVWQMRTGMAVPVGWRVYGICDKPMCVSPSCVACGKPAAAGRHIARTGKFKNQPARVLANRAIGRKRASYTPEQLAEVLASSESGWALARRLKLGRTVVARMRAGQTTAFTPIGGPFTGLLAKPPTPQGAAC